MSPITSEPTRRPPVEAGLKPLPPLPRVGYSAYLWPCVVQLAVLFAGAGGTAAVLWALLRTDPPAPPPPPDTKAPPAAAPVKVDLSALTESLREAREQMGEVQARLAAEQTNSRMAGDQLRAMLAGLPASAPGAGEVTLPDELRQRLERIEAGGKIKAEPRDVLIVAVLSPHLDYNRDCRRPLADFFRHLEPAEGHRVGLAFVRGDAVKSRVALDRKIAALPFDRFNRDGDPKDLAEDLSPKIGEALAAQFPGGGDAPRRYVVLASWRCPCPEKGWGKPLSRVDAVLIRGGDEKDDPKRDENIARWRAFCAERDGTCHVPRAPVKGDATAAVARELQELARPIRKLP